MRKTFWAILLAFFYSVVYTVAGPMVAVQDVTFKWSYLISFLFCFIVCSIVNYFIFLIIPQLYLRFGKKLRFGKGHISQYFDKIGSRKLFLLVWLFIFASWVPAYLIFYPGVLSYDMISQVNSALGTIADNHHPVLHTWLIRFFMRLGDALFSSYEFGIGLLSLLQMLLLSYALTRLAFLLKRKKVPLLIVILTVLLSAGWFMNACLSVSMIKDSLHAVFLVLFACHFTEMATDLPGYFRQKRNLLFFPVIGFLMCAFRNNGIYIYMFCFIGLFLLKIVQIKRAKAYIALIAVILLTPFLYKIYTGPVFTALGIAQTEVREALSVPIQQLQRVAVKRAEELTEEQSERMKYYIDDLEWTDDSICEYDPFCADHAKSCFYSEHYSDDPLAFWKFYLQIGRQFSKEYVMAFLSNTLGYWYPGYYGFSYVMYENYPPEVFAEPLERKSILHSELLEKYYESLCNSDFWRRTPVLRLFFVPGFTLWFLLYALILAWKERGFFTRVFPLFFPLIAQYGIMLLSPITSFRYSWPLCLMLPLAFIGICGDCGLDTLQSRQGDKMEN